MQEDTLYRLSDSVVAEPLINSWPAWSPIISPVPASLHLLHHQVKTLQSYLEDPESHVSAAHDPRFAGGPFSDIPAHRAAEVSELLAATKEKQSANLELARIITEFCNWFVDDAKGQCLESYYDQLPDELRGYVELVYDYYNQPTVRFLEGLLYESKYYDKSLQSLRLFNHRRDNGRTFFMSTPRLLQEGEIDWPVSFDDPLVNELFALDLAPQPLGRIRELLNLPAADEHKLLALLSSEQLPSSPQWEGSEVRLKYFGHACVLVEWKGVSILTDPFISVTPSEGGVDRYTFRDLPAKIDYALVTHNHQDHFVIETLLRLRHRIGCLVVPKSYGLLLGDISLKLMAQKLKFKQVIELDTLEAIPLPGGEIVGIPFLGEHGDLAHGKIAFVVRVGKEQMLFGADSDCLDQRMYENVRRALGPIETVFIGTECVGAPLTWDNGPLFLRKPAREYDQSRRYHGCDSKAALSLLETVGAKRLYNYAMGREPWLEHILGLGLSEDSLQLCESRRLVQRARSRGFLASESPFGKCEIYLRDGSEKPLAEVRDEAALALPGEISRVVSGAAQLDYWSKQLGGALPVLDWPLALQRSELAAPSNAPQTAVIPRELVASLVELSGRNDCPLFTVMLAAFKVLLHQYTEQDDVIVGTIIDAVGTLGKELSESDSVDTLVVRTDLSGDPDFLTLLARLKEVLARATANQRLPFAALQQSLLAGQQAGSGRIFQVMLTLNQSRYPGERLPGESDCDMSLALHEADGGMVAKLAYRAELFTEEAMIELLEHYQVLLESIVAYPEQTLYELPLVGQASFAGISANLESFSDREDPFAF